MIVRHVNDKEVLDTTYLAHGGAIAQMILDRRILKEIGFLAIARLAPGKEIEGHTDPMEEIYFVLSGSGEMRVDDETRQVGPGDATWIPVGSMHALKNNGDTVQIDSRPSDAVAIALRMNAPIFVAETVIQKASVDIDDETQFQISEISTLSEQLEKAIETEDYERAAILRDKIKDIQSKKETDEKDDTEDKQTTN